MLQILTFLSSWWHHFDSIEQIWPRIPRVQNRRFSKYSFEFLERAPENHLSGYLGVCDDLRRMPWGSRLLNSGRQRCQNALVKSIRYPRFLKIIFCYRQLIPPQILISWSRCDRVATVITRDDCCQFKRPLKFKNNSNF